MGLITAWVAYALLKHEVQKGYIQVTADVEEMVDAYTEPQVRYGILDGQLVDLVTGEIVELPKTTEVTDDMEETAKARHDLTTD